MNDGQAAIRAMSEREYRKIPVGQIVVVNPRKREKKQFASNVRSIRDIGLYKPIVVNKRNLEKAGNFELVCGQGRLEAHLELERAEIQAEVIDVPREVAEVMTLGENFTRTPQATIEYAEAIKKMHDEGMGLQELGAITGRSKTFLCEYITLIEHGEERLLKGVEEGVFPLTFAKKVAASKERSMQHLLIDAFDNGVINSKNISRVRAIIDDRQEKGKKLGGRSARAKYTVDKLKRDIRRVTKEKEGFVFEAEQKENRANQLVLALKKLMDDGTFATLCAREKIDNFPELACRYAGI